MCDRHVWVSSIVSGAKKKNMPHQGTTYLCATTSWSKQKKQRERGGYVCLLINLNSIFAKGRWSNPNIYCCVNKDRTKLRTENKTILNTSRHGFYYFMQYKDWKKTILIHTKSLQMFLYLISSVTSNFSSIDKDLCWCFLPLAASSAPPLLGGSLNG